MSACGRAIYQDGHVLIWIEKSDRGYSRLHNGLQLFVTAKARTSSKVAQFYSSRIVDHLDVDLPTICDVSAYSLTETYKNIRANTH